MIKGITIQSQPRSVDAVSSASPTLPISSTHLAGMNFSYGHSFQGLQALLAQNSMLRAQPQILELLSSRFAEITALFENSRFAHFLPLSLLKPMRINPQLQRLTLDQLVPAQLEENARKSVGVNARLLQEQPFLSALRDNTLAIGNRIKEGMSNPLAKVASLVTAHDKNTAHEIMFQSQSFSSPANPNFHLHAPANNFYALSSETSAGTKTNRYLRLKPRPVPYDNEQPKRTNERRSNKSASSLSLLKLLWATAKNALKSAVTRFAQRR